MRLTLWVCLCLSWLLPSVSMAELESYFPVDGTSATVAGERYLAGVFPTTDGGLYCGCDSESNLWKRFFPYGGLHNITPELAADIGPDLVANAKPLPTECIPICESLGWENPNPVAWRVRQWQSEPDRPAYRISEDETGNIIKGEKLCDVPYGTECGYHVMPHRYNNVEWRSVQCPGGIGMAVCERPSP